MADSDDSCESYSNTSTINKVNENTPVCLKCSVYEDKLKEVNDELKSAEMIIHILQTELQSTRLMDTANKINQIDIGEPGKNQTAETGNWISAKTNIKKQKMNDRSNKINISSSNYSILTSNRFTILHNLNEYDGERNGLQTQEEQVCINGTHESMRRRTPGQIIPTIMNGIAQQTGKRKLLASKNKTRKHEIFILGDSHAKGCAAEVKHYLNNDFNVHGTTIPGAGMEIIKASADAKINQLTSNDVMVLWGGSNDVARNNSTEGLKTISKLLTGTKHTNVIVINAPHRHDLVPNSCVNVEVEVFNRRLLKVAERFKEVQIIEATKERIYYTRHGQHLNSAGKDYMAKKITTTIEHLLKDAKVPTSDERHTNTEVNSPNHQAPRIVSNSTLKASVNESNEGSGSTTIPNSPVATADGSNEGRSTTIRLNSPIKQVTKQLPQSPSIKIKKKNTSGDAGQNLSGSQAPSNKDKEPSNGDAEVAKSSKNQGDAEVGVTSKNQREIGASSSHQDKHSDECIKKNKQIEARDAKNTQTSPISLRRNCLARRDPDFLWM
jgi:hypothetical protein